MTSSHQPEKSAGTESPGADQALSKSQDPAGETTTHPATTVTPPDTKPEVAETPITSATTTETSAAGTTTDEASTTGTPATASPNVDPAVASPAIETPHTEPAAAEDKGAPVAQPTVSEKRLLLGVGGAFVAVIAVLVLAAFVWPGFLAGPGTPDSKASEAAAALGSKNPADLDKISCHGPDGKLTARAIPPQALQLIQSAKQVGPPHLSLDTQALVPVDLALTAQGQTQTLPVDVVLGVTNGEWCINGITQRR